MKIFDFVAFDVETTGIDASKDEIIEIGAVKFVNAKPKKAFNHLIKPNFPIPEGATRVNGITNEMVADASKIDEVLDLFAPFCGDLPLVAHNAKFDLGFITAALEKHGVRSPQGEVFDTLSMARQVMPELFSYKLEKLVKELNIDTEEGFHRAEQDAVHCGNLFVKLIRRISTNGTLPPMENLYNLSGGEMRFPQIDPQPRQMGLF